MSAVGISLGRSATPPCTTIGVGANNSNEGGCSASTCHYKDEGTRPAEIVEPAEKTVDSDETFGDHGDDLFAASNYVSSSATGIDCSANPSSNSEMLLEEDNAGFDRFPAVNSDISDEVASAPPPEQAAAQTPRKKKTRPKLTPTSENSVDPSRSQPEINGLDFDDFALGNAFMRTSASKDQSLLVEESRVSGGNAHDCLQDKAMPLALSDDNWVEVQTSDAQPPSVEAVNTVMCNKIDDRPLKEHPEPKDDVGDSLQAFKHIENGPDGDAIPRRPDSTTQVDSSAFVRRDGGDGTPHPGNMGDFREATTIENVDDQVASQSSGHCDALGLSRPVVSDACVSEKPSEPSADEVDDDCGGFGAFTGDEADDATKPSTQKSAAMDVGDIEPSPADADDFGDFGSFDAFEEATPNQTPVVEERSSNGELSREEATSLPRQSSRLEVLNAAVRSIFQDVFSPSTSLVDDHPAVCTELPFNVEMRLIMPVEDDKVLDDAAEEPHRSERELERMRQDLTNFPRTPPNAILSKERWYPYSHYDFHRDGTRYFENVESLTPVTVPDVLQIALPTGFDASDIPPKGSIAQCRPSAPPTAPFQANPTVVDFPTTPVKRERIKTAPSPTKNCTHGRDDDYSKMSAGGKLFMDQLPDLSYMLGSTLSLPQK